MHAAHPWSEMLPYHRTVEVAGQQVFKIHYAKRNAVFGKRDATHEVADESVIDDYQDSLVSSFRQLIDNYGWIAWDNEPDLAQPYRDVAVFDLGPSMLGGAVEFRGQTPYLVLNARTLDPPDVSQRQRQSTVAHELVHLLQFPTPAYRHWPARGRIGDKWDPNWWLHEATALALESKLAAEAGSTLPLYWDWATSPEKSLDGDPGGTMAAPFLIFLAERFGWRFLSDLYQATAEFVDGMRGTDILAWGICRKRNRRDGEPANDCFAKAFTDYCTHTAVVDNDNSLLPADLYSVVGPRALTDQFTQYPVVNAGIYPGIEHLGCRYFEFLPPSTSKRLFASVVPCRSQDLSVLRGEIVVVGKDRTLQRFQLRPVHEQLEGCADFSRTHDARAILVIANCAHGAGWTKSDSLQFTVNANVE